LLRHDRRQHPSPILGELKKLGVAMHFQDQAVKLRVLLRDNDMKVTREFEPSWRQKAWK
jgi:hypothetical protein